MDDNDFVALVKVCACAAIGYLVGSYADSAALGLAAGLTALLLADR